MGSFAMYKPTIADDWKSFTILRTLVHGTGHGLYDFWIRGAYVRHAGDVEHAATPKSGGFA